MMKNHQVTKTQNKTKWAIIFLCIIAPLAIASVYIITHDWPKTFFGLPFNPWHQVVWEYPEIVFIPGIIVWGVMTIACSKWLAEKNVLTKKIIKGSLFLIIQIILWFSILSMHWLAFTATLSGGPVIGFPMFPYDLSFLVTIAIGIIFSVLISVLYFKGEDG